MQREGTKVSPSLVCYTDKGGLHRDYKTPGISPYRTPAEKWISVYLPGIISAADKEDAIVSCQKWLAAKMQATGSKGVQIAN